MISKKAKGAQTQVAKPMELHWDETAVVAVADTAYFDY